MTFRIRTPESIDPGRTNPDAQMVAAMTDSVGSSSPAVARILLQNRDILEAAPLVVAVDKPAVIQALHSCKESAVVCEKVAARVAGRVDAIVAEVQASGVKRDSRGRALNPFPQVPELHQDATSFLIHAKRALCDICACRRCFSQFPRRTTISTAWQRRSRKPSGRPRP